MNESNKNWAEENLATKEAKIIQKQKITPRIIFFGFLGLAILVIFLTISLRSLREIKLKTNSSIDSRLTQLKIRGKLQNVTTIDIKKAIKPLLKEEFLDLDLGGIHQAISNLPWVRSLLVRRVYPNTLLIDIKEQKAAVIWNETAYLNPQGEIFKPSKITQTDLIKINGDISKAKILLRLFVSLKDLIGRESLKTIFQKGKGAYRLKLANGIEVVLGRKYLSKRIGRLAKILTALGVNADKVERIDFRYQQGVALKFFKKKHRNGDRNV